MYHVSAMYAWENVIIHACKFELLCWNGISNLRVKLKISSLKFVGTT